MFRNRSQRGFTLLELLVALVVFAIMSAIAYGGLNRIMQAREKLLQENRKWTELMRVIGRIEEDVSLAVNRTYRNAFDVRQPGFQGIPLLVGDDDAQLSLIRMGPADKASVASDMIRVGYRFRNGRLELLQWSALDQAPRDTPRAHLLLDGIKGFKATFLSPEGTWDDHWPPNSQVVDVLPTAVRIELTLGTGELVTRVMALP